MLYEYLKWCLKSDNPRKEMAHTEKEKKSLIPNISPLLYPLRHKFLDGKMEISVK